MKNNYRPEIKICGITNLDDARAACEAGADYIGFVLYRKSPRAITPTALRNLLDKIERKVRTVGVFVNESADTVAKIAADCGLNFVQLCAEESFDEFCRLPVPIWRVIRIHNSRPEPAPEKWPANRYVLDTTHEKKYGGTGKVVDWTIAARFAKKHKIMLAGGLTPENVKDAIRIVHPAGVDVASGVERAPGKKDLKKIRFFIEAVRKA
jgi:phosphoribosylanthranilate isomerase